MFLGASLALSYTACTHGFAGARFFPATVSADDPFANDELPLHQAQPICNKSIAPTARTFFSARGRRSHEARAEGE